MINPWEPWQTPIWRRLEPSPFVHNFANVDAEQLHHREGDSAIARHFPCTSLVSKAPVINLNVQSNFGFTRPHLSLSNPFGPGNLAGFGKSNIGSQPLTFGNMQPSLQDVDIGLLQRSNSGCSRLDIIGGPSSVSSKVYDRDRERQRSNDYRARSRSPLNKSFGTVAKSPEVAHKFTESKSNVRSPLRLKTSSPLMTGVWQKPNKLSYSVNSVESFTCTAEFDQSKPSNLSSNDNNETCANIEQSDSKTKYDCTNIGKGCDNTKVDNFESNVLLDTFKSDDDLTSFLGECLDIAKKQKTETNFEVPMLKQSELPSQRVSDFNAAVKQNEESFQLSANSMPTSTVKILSASVQNLNDSDIEVIEASKDKFLSTSMNECCKKEGRNLLKTPSSVGRISANNKQSFRFDNSWNNEILSSSNTAGCVNRNILSKLINELRDLEKRNPADVEIVDKERLKGFKMSESETDVVTGTSDDQSFRLTTRNAKRKTLLPFPDNGSEIGQSDKNLPHSSCINSDANINMLPKRKALLGDPTDTPFCATPTVANISKVECDQSLQHLGNAKQRGLLGDFPMTKPRVLLGNTPGGSGIQKIDLHSPAIAQPCLPSTHLSISPNSNEFFDYVDSPNTNAKYCNKRSQVRLDSTTVSPIGFNPDLSRIPTSNAFQLPSVSGEHNRNDIEAEGSVVAIYDQSQICNRKEFMQRFDSNDDIGQFGSSVAVYDSRQMYSQKEFMRDKCLQEKCLLEHRLRQVASETSFPIAPGKTYNDLINTFNSLASQKLNTPTYSTSSTLHSSNSTNLLSALSNVLMKRKQERERLQSQTDIKQIRRIFEMLLTDSKSVLHRDSQKLQQVQKIVPILSDLEALGQPQRDMIVPILEFAKTLVEESYGGE